MLLFRQLLDLRSFTYTYLLADSGTRQAVLIDPVFEHVRRDAALIDEMSLDLRYTLETHVHADHVTGAWLLREQLGCRIVVSGRAGTTGHDRLVDDGDRVQFGDRSLTVLATPGHTSGCVSYLLDDRSMVFTGDALLIRGAGRTDFQQGDARTLYDSVHAQLFSLPDGTLVYPGHDYGGRTASSVGEEKRYNPRLGGARSVEDFVGFMDNLGLPHPRRLEVAVPANLRSGQPEEPPPESRWAPVARTYAGVPEVDAHWLAEHLDRVRVIDVRDPPEFDGELGHVPGAVLVPLGTLRSALTRWNKSDPIVTVCRSGGRSAQAAAILEQAGFERVANLADGMIRWRSAGLPLGPPLDPT